MVDVAIVGAGTAGAAVAWQLARRGMRVVAVDRRALDDTGARWSNGVSARAFDEAGLPRPTGREDRGNPAMHLFAGWGPACVRVTSDLREVDMRALTARLHGLAASAGATLRGGVAVRGWTPSTGLDTDAGPIRARWYVDASGMHGLPWLPGERVPRTRMCAAAQQTREVTDVGAARAFFDRLGVAEGDVACFTGVAGGYSIVNVRWHGREMAILTGSIPASGAASGPVLLDRFVAEQAAWVGRPLWGGARAIPLGPPAARLDHGPWLQVGDAARMVYASHGSGVGPQLAASATIGRVLATGGTPADVTAAWRAAHRGELQRAHVFQRVSETITPSLLARLIRTGLLHPALIQAGLEQRPPRVDRRLAGDLARAALRDPRAFARLVPGVVGVG